MSESTNSYAAILTELRSAYDRSATDRDQSGKSEWKRVERAAFLERLRAERKTRLLEIGAGTGQDSLYFMNHGLEVVATDASHEMIAKCRAKGLDAHVMDFLSLTLPPESFDAGYAFNCLLHVPNADFPAVLQALRVLLAPGALLYIGTYGGESFEGLRPDDWHDPPRFFSFRSDEELLQAVRPYFDLVDFHAVTNEHMRFQALTVRRPGICSSTARPSRP